MRVIELHYSNTNTYLIEGDCGFLLFDTGLAGTFPAFCRSMGELKIPIQAIDRILISHFHPDHCGIAQQIANEGAVILVPDVQLQHIHDADAIFIKDADKEHFSIIDEKIRMFPIEDGRRILSEIGINGEIVHTPGHSDDSVSLFLDDGSLFVGDLNPLYELELHKGTQVETSWNMLLSLHPKTVYYGHAKTADIIKAKAEPVACNEITYKAVSGLLKLIDKGCDLSRIQKKTGLDKDFIEDVTRMYLTHRDISVQGILDRIEIKNR